MSEEGVASAAFPLMLYPLLMVRQAENHILKQLNCRGKSFVTK